MSQKLARIDAESMNALYASELKKAGLKVAAEDTSIQAFQDKAEYLEVLKSVMSDDKKDSGDPNDPELD